MFRQKNKGKNAVVPGEDRNDFIYAAQISLSQLIIAQDKPLELAVPLQKTDLEIFRVLLMSVWR